MQYNDDLLDVNAYLESKIKKNLEDTKELIGEFSEIGNSYDEMNSEIDSLLADACKAAEKLDVDISGVDNEIHIDEPVESNNISPDFIIRLSENYDFSGAFRELADKAHEERFVNVRPEDVLTEEELRRTIAFEEELDAQFSQQTGLTEKDMQVLLISVAVRVLYFYVLKLFLNELKDGSAPKNTLNGITAEPVINAMQNVDIDKSSDDDAIKQLMALAVDKFVNFNGIKSERQILDDNIPFDVEDNEFFLRKDILGYHPLFGWLIGVINILTDTVTTNKIETYSVINSLYEEKIQVNEKIQTIGVFLPIMSDLMENKDSFLAAVVRQAEAMKAISAPINDVSAMLKNTIAAEENNFALLDKADVFTKIVPFDLSTLSLGGIFRDAAVSAFFNKLITAFHAVRYNPETDGDLKKFTVRTYKIIAISSVIAASINSVPALITENLSDVDVSGIIMSLFASFNSIKFWIKAKSDYLVSEYKREIDKSFASIDKYFEIVPDEAADTEGV